jgi:hypothetical protein
MYLSRGGRERKKENTKIKRKKKRIKENLSKTPSEKEERIKETMEEGGTNTIASMRKHILVAYCMT